MWALMCVSCSVNLFIVLCSSSHFARLLNLPPPTWGGAGPRGGEQWQCGGGAGGGESNQCSDHGKKVGIARMKMEHGQIDVQSKACMEKLCY